MDRVAFEHAFHQGVYAAASYLEKSAENYAAIAKGWLAKNPKKSLAAGALALGGAGLAAAPVISAGNKKEEAFLSSVAGKGKEWVTDMDASVRGSDNRLLTALGIKNRPLTERLADAHRKGMTSNSEESYIKSMLEATAPEQKILARY